MPTYSYECPNGHRVEEVRRIANRNDPLQCSTCNSAMELRIVPAHVGWIVGGGNFPGYHCVVSDEWVTSKKQRREIMKRYDIVEVG